MNLRKFVEALDPGERKQLWNLLNPDKLLTDTEVGMDFISAIKSVRDRLGLDLRTAKELVEREQGR